MNCPKCGELQRDEAIFCPTCGNRLRPQPLAPVPLPPSPPRSSRRIVPLLAGVGFIAIAALGGFLFLRSRPVVRSLPPAAAVADAPRALSPAQAPAGLSILLNGLQGGSAPLPDMVKVAGDEQSAHFTRPNDRREILGVAVESVRYTYLRGNLLWLVSYMVKTENAAALLASMKKVFGEPEWVDSDGFLHWFEPKGDQKTYVLSAAYATEPTGEAGVVVMSGPVSKQAQAVAMSEAVRSVEAESRTDASVGASPNRVEGDTYTARLSCGAAGRPVPIAQCFAKSSLKVRRGTGAKVFSSVELYEAAGTSDHVKLDLPASFEIEAMNSAPFDMIVLSLTITEISTGKVVYEDQAARWGWIKVKN